MSDYEYTRDAGAEIEVHSGDIALRFCDATVAQWSHNLGPLADWSDDDLIVEIADLIEMESRSLASSLVMDLRSRVLATPATHREDTLNG